MSESPSRSELKAIRSPLVAHAGRVSFAWLFVRFFMFPPSTSMRWISQVKFFPSREANAICIPSGDHAGEVSWPACLLNWIGLVPSGFINQISDPRPPRVDSKAMNRPFGDHAGAQSYETPIRVIMSKPLNIAAGSVHQIYVASSMSVGGKGNPFSVW